MPITLREAAQTMFDVVALGECMVRLAPPAHGRIEFAKTLEVDVGGGEFNMAYACARVGLRTAFLSKLPDNPVARIILNHARAAGMSVEHVALEKYDGLGRKGRVGLNFTEVGTGVRPSVTMYDRGHSSASQIAPSDLDWEKIYREQGVRWLHTGGIFAALSESCAETLKAALREAKAAGAIASFDFNYRSSLWNPEKAKMVRKEIVPHVQVLMASEDDLRSILGLAASDHSSDPIASYKQIVAQVTKEFPNLKAVCTTLREVKSGLLNHWSGILWHEGEFFHARQYRDMEIEDRVGGGDAFSGGIAYGFISGMKPQEIVDFAVAYGALVHTTRGDTSQATLDEVMHVMKGGSARIQR